MSAPHSEDELRQWATRITRGKYENPGAIRNRRENGNDQREQDRKYNEQ